LEPLDVAAVRKSRRLVSRRPSAGKTGTLNAAQAFSLEGRGGADFGTAVHALLAEVEWLDEAGLDRFDAAWPEFGAAGAEALACLHAPALASVWKRPAAARAEVWRERAFEVVLDGVWITGVFDRVVVAQDAAGRAMRAEVFDFKTDTVADESGVADVVGRHAAQLGVYRQVAAVLAGLDPAVVECTLVITRLRSRAQVPHRAK
jgi:ATP-dependent helicase/nuclease subunit A